MITNTIKVRCFVIGKFFRWPLLAIKAKGVSQHLNTNRGVAIESTERINERLCHLDIQCLFISAIAAIDKKALCRIVTGQRFFLETTKLVKIIPIVINIRVIIFIWIYSAHSNPPFIHSNTKPKVRININIVAAIIRFLGLVIKTAPGRGNRSAISRSNNKNNIATRKNRKEKGRRAEFKGSNPHS